MWQHSAPVVDCRNGVTMQLRFGERRKCTQIHAIKKEYVDRAVVVPPTLLLKFACKRCTYALL